MEGVSFRLLSIGDMQFSFSNNDELLSSVNKDNLKFQYRIDSEIHISEGVIYVIPQIRYMIGRVEIFHATASIEYAFDDLNSIVNIEDGGKMVNFKFDILPPILSASYDTLRGLVHMKTMNTPLAEFPIPMIGVKLLIEKGGISVI